MTKRQSLMDNLKYYLIIGLIAIVAVEVWRRVRSAIIPAAKSAQPHPLHLMASANLRREFLRQPTSTTIPATGASQVRWGIPLRSNTRLVKIEPHLNLTVSAAMAARTTSFDMENFVRYADNGLRLGGLKRGKARIAAAISVWSRLV